MEFTHTAVDFNNPGGINPNAHNQPITVRGRVVDEYGDALPGATVHVVNSSIGLNTDIEGDFALENVNPGDELHVRYMGYQTQVFQAKSTLGVIQLLPSVDSLDTIVITAEKEPKKVNWFKVAGLTTAAILLLKIATNSKPKEVNI